MTPDKSTGQRVPAGPPKRTVRQVAFVADIHDGPDVISRHLDLCAEHDVDDVVILGDAVSAETIAAFEGYMIHYVVGNGELNQSTMRDTVKTVDDLGGIVYGRDGRVQFGDTQFMIRHGDVTRDMGYAMAATNADVVVHGHYHYQEDNHIGDGRVMNPGPDGCILYDVPHDRFEFHTHEDVQNAEARPGYVGDTDD